MIFKLREFLITRPKTISLEIADKLFWHHILPMIEVRNELGVYITASDYSGYRPKWWEFKKKRSGNSEHVFDGKGAVDWTCKDFKKNGDTLLDLIIKHTEYKRICVYDTFIHCDYKDTPSNKRRLYRYDKKGGEWMFFKNI